MTGIVVAMSASARCPAGLLSDRPFEWNPLSARGATRRKRRASVVEIFRCREIIFFRARCGEDIALEIL